MTIQIQEQNLTYTFPSGWVATKYDEWQFYRQQGGFHGTLSGIKGVDILAIGPSDNITWLIEVKDFRVFLRTKPTDLIEEITSKVVFSLAGLVAAKYQATNANEKQIAADAIKTNELRVIFHLEQTRSTTRPFRYPFDVSKLQQKLRKRLRAIDPFAIIVDTHFSFSPWQVV